MNVIVLRGVVSGQGRKAECEILAWKAIAGSIHAYSQLRVVEAPADFGDGEYLLQVDGVDTPTKKTHGIWEMITFAS